MNYWFHKKNIFQTVIIVTFLLFMSVSIGSARGIFTERNGKTIIKETVQITEALFSQIITDRERTASTGDVIVENQLIQSGGNQTNIWVCPQDSTSPDDCNLEIEPNGVRGYTDTVFQVTGQSDGSSIQTPRIEIDAATNQTTINTKTHFTECIRSEDRECEENVISVESLRADQIRAKNNRLLIEAQDLQINSLNVSSLAKQNICFVVPIEPTATNKDIATNVCPQGYRDGAATNEYTSKGEFPDTILNSLRSDYIYDENNDKVHLCCKIEPDYIGNTVPITIEIDENHPTILTDNSTNACEKYGGKFCDKNAEFELILDGRSLGVFRGESHGFGLNKRTQITVNVSPGDINDPIEHFLEVHLVKNKYNLEYLIPYYNASRSDVSHIADYSISISTDSGVINQTGNTVLRENNSACANSYFVSWQKHYAPVPLNGELACVASADSTGGRLTGTNYGTDQNKTVKLEKGQEGTNVHYFTVTAQQ